MSQFASTNFNGTATTELSAFDASFVKHPTSGSGIAQISNANRLRHGSDVQEARYYHSATPPSADYSVSVDIVKIGSGGGSPAVCGRMHPTTTDYYWARYATSLGAWQLFVTTTGFSAEQIGSDYTQTLTAGQTYRLTLEMSGNTISLKVDGVTRVTATNTRISSSFVGKAGLRDANTAGSDTNYTMVDNFSADTLGGADGTGTGAPVVSSFTAPAASATGTTVIDGAATGAFTAMSMTVPTASGVASVVGDGVGTGSPTSSSLGVPVASATGTTVANGTGTGAPAALGLSAPGASAAGTTSGAGTFVSPVLKNNTGYVLINETGVIVNVYDQTSGTLVLHKTGQTSNSSGIVTVTDAVLTPGVTYAYEIVLTSARRLPLATAA